MQSKNCLLIEDNPADAFLIKKMLNPDGLNGYRVTLASNLKDSFILLNQDHFDFVISDLGLPDSQGLETVKSVLNNNMYLPIIVLTSNDNEQLGNDALSIGAQDYLIKGKINSDQLLRSIRYAFRRKKVESKLRESEEKFRTMVEISPEAVITLDTHANINYVSKRAVEIHGYQNENNLIGKSSSLLFAGGEEGKTWARFKSMLKTGKIRDEEFLLECENKTHFFGEISVSANIDEQNKVTGYLVVTKDISERKKHENAIKNYQQNLRSLVTQLNLAEEKERRKIAVELHDHLGQSLAMAKIRLSVLKSGDISPDSSGNLKEVERHIVHAIDYSRILTYELSPPVLFELGLNEAIRWKLDQVTQKTGIKTNLITEDVIPPLKEDSAILVFRSFCELVNNVIKHSEAKQISVLIFMNENNLTVKVQDDGLGFDPEVLVKPVSHSNKMGLFSVRERLEYFDGKLLIDTRKGEGTKIEIKVPVLVK
jgi:PAS domain S-box-containing protein